MSKSKKSNPKKQPIITAVDLGTTKISVIIAQLNPDRKLEIKGFGESKSQGMDNGNVQDIRKASEAIKRSIEKAEEMSDMQAENLFVSISGKYIKSTNGYNRLTISDPNRTESGVITQEHIDKVIKSAVDNVLTEENDKNLKLIHSIPQYYKIDNQPETLSPIEMSGDILQGHIHVVLADINCIKNVRRCFELIGYKIKEIVFSPLADAKAVLSDDEKQLGCVLVDIGGGTNDIIFFYDKIIVLSSVLAVGGNNITFDISKHLPTTVQEAERIKTSYGTTVASEDDEQIGVKGIGDRQSVNFNKSLLTEIIYNRLSTILEDTFKLISSDNYHKYLDAGVILTGGTADLKNIDQLCGSIFNKQVRIGKPDLSGITGQKSEFDHPKYSTTIGLLYYAKDFFDAPEEVISVQQNQGNSSIKDFFRKAYESLSDYF